ncbi:MAG TPA: alpha/beta fold hydrolase [Allosphingosinicella sp.]
MIPGFLANDASTSFLRRTLDAAGHRAFGWSFGMNRGARRDTLTKLGTRLDEVVAETGKPVTLIGWSLGGLYARELARHRREHIDLVVTLGTPFAVDLHANNAWRLYELVNGHKVDNPPIPIELDHKPPVRTIALWSARDGIVAPASARGSEQGSDERIEVDCTHMEFVSDRRALRAILEVLAR